MIEWIGCWYFRNPNVSEFARSLEKEPAKSGKISVIYKK